MRNCLSDKCEMEITREIVKLYSAYVNSPKKSTKNLYYIALLLLYKNLMFTNTNSNIIFII